jgi:S1-C subfamily serine protease
VFGHPGGQDPLRIAPARINQRVEAVGRDLYDAHQTRRDVFILASDLRPGDSGAALVNTTGAVMGVAFAIAPDRPGTAYALSSVELRAVLAVPRGNQASTGQCLGEA